jgi:uncharacterized protein (DUF39 family)
MNSWTEVYTRCMDGEYFRGAYCPRDGHSNETSIGVARLVVTMREEGIVPSLAVLVERGFNGPLVDVVIAEFVSREYAPDWFRPE